MNIYEPEGTDAIVDLRAAAAELRSVGSITSESARRHAVAEINTAALLDIALSLRVVAAEARAAMPSPFTETTEEPEPETPHDFLIVGDLVTAEGMDEPGEIRAFGTSEGDIYAEVVFAGGAESRVWIDKLTRLYGDERDDVPGTVETASFREPQPDGSIVEIVAELTTSEDGKSGTVREVERRPVEPEPDVRDLVDDDIDADFDGDHHPAAANALDVLKANEAARKASKKKGSKK